MIRGQSYCFLGIITIYFFFCLSSFPNTFAASPTRSLCRRDQKDAFLELQKEFPIYIVVPRYGTILPMTWNNSVDCCSWDGVKCDTLLGVVVSLDIRCVSTTINTNFTSSSALFKLQHITELNFSSCSLQGVIPSSIGNLSHLTYLDLSHNHLVGEIPASFGNLNQLITMYLYDNVLTGNIPTSFANLTKLSGLYLGKNQFNGGLDLVLPNLTSLSTLDLSSNHFQSSIFPYLSSLHNLEDFDGSDNSFIGPFPSSLLTISSLGILDLSHNDFGGQIPTSISKLVNLRLLDFSYNKLEGQVPHCLWRSSQLDSVHLSHNSFNSFGDSVEVIDGASVKELDLASNSFQGPLPQWICKLSFLSSLDLSNNGFTGSIPRCLSRLHYSLYLRNNSLSGFIPDLCRGNGSLLGSLDLSRNNLVGELPKSLINCTGMVFLNVKGNKIKDTFPFWLGSLHDLTILVLGTNAFYGPIYNPSAYLGFPSLRIIDLSNNNFIGSLPQDYFASWSEMSSDWSGKREFTYHYMRFDFLEYASIDLVYKGVDTEFARIFQSFAAIDFSGNQFCGDIPESIGLLKMQLLNLSDNIFTGNIPPSLANITKLEILDLSQNNLSSEIPQDLGKLTFLSNINFSYNHLEGMVPQSTQFLSQSCSSFVGNPNLHGFEETCGEIHHVPVPTTPQPDESLSEPEVKIVNWIAAAIAFGPGVFCGLVIGHIFTFYKYEWLRAKLC